MELRKFANCGVCDNKILSSGIPMFWRVTLERFGVEMKAVDRQQGLTMFMGGSALLANVMGADEEMTTSMLDQPIRFTVCEKCAGENISLYQMMDRGVDKKSET